MRKLLSALTLLVILCGQMAFGLDPKTECSEELLLPYFPEIFARTALENHKVAQEKITAILADLKAADALMNSKIEESAKKMKPNPFEAPINQQAAAQVFFDAMAEVFASIMQKNGIQDEEMIFSILEEIQMEKAKRFAECFENGAIKMPSPPQRPL